MSPQKRLSEPVREHHVGRRPAPIRLPWARQNSLWDTPIRTPFASRLGRNLAAEGALVGPATGALNTLIQPAPVYVAFDPNETALVEIEWARAAGKILAEVSTSGGPGEPGVVRAGDLTFLDKVIDRATGTIVARVTIENLVYLFAPGRHVRVRLPNQDEPDAQMAPVAALGSNQIGKNVYGVRKDEKAELASPELG